MSNVHSSKDPLQRLIDGHEQVSEWLKLVEEAATLPEHPVDDIGKLQDFFRDNVRTHFQFEEEEIFPPLLESNPAPETIKLIAELREEHQLLLIEVASVLRELALELLKGTRSARMVAKVHSTIDALKLHAEKEDLHLLPLVRARRASYQEK